MNQEPSAKQDLFGRLTGPGPKRILALDGGGIRGVITLCLLDRIESILRQRHGDPDLRLADYFDLIGGTSTGAIIAAGLAVGMSVAEMREAYRTLGASVLSRRKVKVWQSLLDENPLRDGLKSYFGDIRMGDSDIRTGLCIVAKRADTNSTWPLHNHPRGKFYGENRALLLREVVRASAAAPLLFVPEKLDIGGGIHGLFVDGGVSLAANPAWLLFLVATLKGYSFRWPTGADRLLLVSVGTGSWPWEADIRQKRNRKTWDWALDIPFMLMNRASTLEFLGADGRTTNGFTLSWPVAPGRRYGVLATEALPCGLWPLTDGPREATNGQTIMQWTDTNMPATRFYRIDMHTP